MDTLISSTLSLRLKFLNFCGIPYLIVLYVPVQIHYLHVADDTGSVYWIIDVALSKADFIQKRSCCDNSDIITSGF